MVLDLFRRGSGLLDHIQNGRAVEMVIDDQGKRRLLIPFFDGQYQKIHQDQIVSAFPHIEKRLQYSIPIDTVDVEDVKKLIRYINVNVSRPCQPEEVRGLVEQIKAFLAESIDKMPHHERYLSERDCDHDDEYEE